MWLCCKSCGIRLTDCHGYGGYNISPLYLNASQYLLSLSNGLLAGAHCRLIFVYKCVVVVSYDSVTFDFSLGVCHA
jgi:hypothetical protein